MKQLTKDRVGRQRPASQTPRPKQVAQTAKAASASSAQTESALPPHYPDFIYGIHESGGEDLMLKAGRPGWVLELAAIGLDGSSQPADFSALADAGLGVVVRINHGYGSTGTLPLPQHYHRLQLG